MNVMFWNNTVAMVSFIMWPTMSVTSLYHHSQILSCGLIG